MSAPAPRAPGEPGRVVIVGASLAGLRAAEALRGHGFGGRLTVLGDEPFPPYDRPPLSKQVPAGRLPSTDLALAQRPDLDAQWSLGWPATRLDRPGRRVELADGRSVEYDRLLIATGSRARPWPNRREASLDGVLTLRTRGDADRLRKRLAAQPRRVLIVGGGFIGSELASVCRDLGLAVTLVERAATPAARALGETIGRELAALQRSAGVDLRCGTTVMALEGDRGRLRRAHLSDGGWLDVDLAVVALGTLRNCEWLGGSGLAADERGLICDGSCRAVDADRVVLDDVFAAGDVARWPHRLYDGRLLAVEHWSNAVEQAETAAHNMLCAPDARRAYTALPSFWSHQFGLNVKSIGLPSCADSVVVTQGDVAARRFVAAYGRRGRTVAAVAFDRSRWLPAYQALIEDAAPFPPDLRASDQPAGAEVAPAGFHPDDRTPPAAEGAAAARQPCRSAVLA